jgi:hypothetical protein
MASKIFLKESELISVIKNIVEQAKLEYDELDYMAAFVQIYMDWIRKNTPEKFWSYPFGFLIKKYSKPFLIDMTGADYRNMDDYNDYEISKWDIDRIVKTIVSRGGYKLPTLYSEEKFTEKYSRILPEIIEQLELPEYASVRFVEDDPKFVKVFVDVPFATMLLSPNAKHINTHNLERKIHDFVKNYLGLEIGNPAHGELKLDVKEPKLVGLESWVKDVLNKVIKKEIRSFPESRDLKSIRFEPNTNGAEMKFVFKNYPSYQSRSALRDKVKSYFSKLGFPDNKIRIEI